ALQDEIPDNEVFQADQLDLEVGLGIAVDVAVDDGAVARSAGAVVEALDQLAGHTGEVACAVPTEGLVASDGGPGIDRAEAEPVLAAPEVEDDAAQPEARSKGEVAVDEPGLVGRRIQDRREGEHVATGVAGEPIGATAAEDAVVAAIAVDNVVAAEP